MWLLQEDGKMKRSNGRLALPDFFGRRRPSDVTVRVFTVDDVENTPNMSRSADTG